jgi:hypothetical protein
MNSLEPFCLQEIICSDQNSAMIQIDFINEREENDLYNGYFLLSVGEI